MGSTVIRQPMPSPTTSNIIRKPISSRRRAINTAFEIKKETSSQTGSVSTKGGDYPVYSKDSDEAADFNKAFALARKAGKKKFSWQGRSYTTDLA